MTEPIWTEAEANVGLKAGAGRIMQLEGEVQRLKAQVEELTVMLAGTTELNGRMFGVVEAARKATEGFSSGLLWTTVPPDRDMKALKDALSRLDAAEKARTATPEGIQ